MKQLPPGPKGFASIHFLQAGLTPPVPVLRKLAAKYGDPFRVAYVSGPVTITGDPEALRQIYSADPGTFAVWGIDVIAPLFGTTSVVVSSGERHRRDRKLLTPAFNGGTMRSYGPLMTQLAVDAASKWKPGVPFSMLETTQAVTLDIMIRVVFGVADEGRIAQTRHAVEELMNSLHPLIFMFPALRREFGGHGPWARNRRAVDALNALLLKEIEERRRTPPTGRTDILSLMMLSRYDDGTVLSETELLDQLRGLLFAGHEATSLSLAWIFYWLHREPRILARVLEEIDDLGPDPTPDAFAGLPYLEAVCLEALRLYPPVVDPARIVKKEFKLLNYTLEPGEALRASISLLHSRPELFPEPDTFRPERFLERKFSPFEFIPFGGGARRCLGAAFSMYEMKVLLGTLVRSHRLRLVDKKPVTHVRRGLTMGPSGGVPMVSDGPRPVTRRAPAKSVAATTPIAAAGCPVTSASAVTPAPLHAAPSPSQPATTAPSSAPSGCPVTMAAAPAVPPSAPGPIDAAAVELAS